MKKMLIYLVYFLLVLSLLTILLLNFYPSFGAHVNTKNYTSEHLIKGKFENLLPTSMDVGFKDFFSLGREYLKNAPQRQPAHPLEVRSLKLTEMENEKSPSIVWFGHSSFLIRIKDKWIFLDPMLGPVPAPFPFLGKKRYQKELPLGLKNIPELDAVILSHDHYDHLDYSSIIALKGKTKHFYAPLGVGQHLERWGVPNSQITELDWYENALLDDLTFQCLPARHFSGRGLLDRWKTLWSSWQIKSKDLNLYFSGDSGYGPHFKEIGEKYGPFDFSLIECGQYNKRWQDIHMMPEETAQAAADLNTKVFMPIHWGTFTLALHDWQEPAQRVIKARKVTIKIPEIGEIINLKDSTEYISKWWN